MLPVTLIYNIIPSLEVRSKSVLLKAEMENKYKNILEDCISKQLFCL